MVFETSSWGIAIYRARETVSFAYERTNEVGNISTIENFVKGLKKSLLFQTQADRCPNDHEFVQITYKNFRDTFFSNKFHEISDTRFCTFWTKYDCDVNIITVASFAELDVSQNESVETHPYAEGGARSRTDRARRIGVLSLKALDVHPDLASPVQLLRMHIA